MTKCVIKNSIFLLFILLIFSGCSRNSVKVKDTEVSTHNSNESIDTSNIELMPISKSISGKYQLYLDGDTLIVEDTFEDYWYNIKLEIDWFDEISWSMDEEKLLMIQTSDWSSYLYYIDIKSQDSKKLNFIQEYDVNDNGQSNWFLTQFHSWANEDTLICSFASTIPLKGNQEYREAGYRRNIFIVDPDLNTIQMITDAKDGEYYEFNSYVSETGILSFDIYNLENNEMNLISTDSLVLHSH